MKTCKDFLEDISAYLDSELSNTDKQALEEHLVNCQVCRQNLAEMKEAWQILDQYTIQKIENSDILIRQFYTKTLPSSLITLAQHSSFKFWYYAQSMIAGVIAGLCIYLGFFYDSPPKEFQHNLKIWNHPDFQIIAHLDLLENYEILEYFPLERLPEWKKKN